MERSFIAILAEGFFSRLSFGIISFTLPLYALRMGMSLTEIGFLIALNTMVAIVLKPVTGHLADRIGLKKSLTIAIGLRSLVALMLPLARTAIDLYAIKATHGISKALRDPPINALIADSGGKKRMASTFAWYQTAKSVSAAFGKGAAGILLSLTASNYGLVFLAAFIVSVIPLFLVMLFVKEKPGRRTWMEKTPTGPARASRKKEAEIKKKGSPALFPFIGLGFLISVTAQMLHGLFPVLATRYAGLSEAQTGIILMAATGVTLLATPFFGWFSDHVSRKTVLMTRGFANIIASVIYMGAANLWGMAAGNIADSVGKSAFRPAWGALMARVSGFDRNQRARTMGLMSMGEDAGTVLGPILAAFLWNTRGIVVMLSVRILLALTTEIFTGRMAGSLKDSKSGSSARQPDAKGKGSHGQTPCEVAHPSSLPGNPVGHSPSRRFIGKRLRRKGRRRRSNAHRQARPGL
jgi:MFS family permease